MKSYTTVAGIAALFGVAFLGASAYIAQSEEQLALMLQVKIAEQEKTLASIAELTDQNRADAVAERIIRDCSPENRTQYETLLNRLELLNTTELIELQSLFDACAAFFAERKAVMVARLEREYQVYRDYVALYAQLDQPASLTKYPTDVWQTLVDLEVTRGQLLSEQVEIQANIIAELKATTTTTEELEVFLVRAQQVANEVTSINAEIDEVRDRLYTL